MKKLVLISMIVVLATGLGARAQEPAERSLFQPVSIHAKGGLTADADFSTSGGSAQVTTGQMSLKAGGFSLGYEGRHYSWSDQNLLNFGNGKDNPWDTLHRVTVGYEYTGAISDDWLYSASATGSSAFEKEISGSLGGALRGGVTYLINENWKTMFGAGVFTNSINTSIMPFLGVSYEKFDQNGAGVFATLGAPGSEAGYAFSESSKIRLSLDMDARTYRLKDESTVVQKGYMSTSDIVAGLHYDWKPTEAFSISFGPEYHFSREMRLYNKNGDKVGGTIKQDAAFGGGVQMGYTF